MNKEWGCASLLAMLNNAPELCPLQYVSVSAQFIFAQITVRFPVPILVVANLQYMNEEQVCIPKYSGGHSD